MQPNIKGEYFIEGSTIKSVNFFSYSLKHDDVTIYEVIRIYGDKLLFWEDHMERLQNSFKVIQQSLFIPPDQLLPKIKMLIASNNIKEGNIKLDFRIRESGERQFSTYFIKTRYPSAEQYQNGVRCCLQHAERPLPTAKIYNPNVRDKANEMIEKKEVYETILVNHDECMTEGSRSNIFFIYKDELITAPDEMVLSGIMRKQVLKIAANLNIKVNYQAIQVSELTKMDGAFLTGTSNRVLPISMLFKVPLEPQHPVYVKIKKELEKVIERQSIDYWD